jgi:hypothetical protein
MVQDTIVAIRRGGDKLVVANLEAEQYSEIEFGTDPTQARGMELLPDIYMLLAAAGAAAGAAAVQNAAAGDSYQMTPYQVARWTAGSSSCPKNATRICAVDSQRAVCCCALCSHV